MPRRARPSRERPVAGRCRERLPLGRRAAAVAGLVALLGAATAASAEPLTVYDDALHSGFDDWSWASVDRSATEVVFEGERSLALDAGPYEALYLRRVDAAIDVADYDALEMRIHGGEGGRQKFDVVLLLDDAELGRAPLDGFVEGAHVAADRWSLVRVDFADLGVTSGQFDSIWLQDASGTRQPVVYLDAIVLVEPRPPGVVSVAAAVDPNADRHPISPLVYGVNYNEQSPTTRSYPLIRWGGTHTSRYSWRYDIANRGADWFFLSIPYENPDPSRLPEGSTTDRLIDAARQRGAEVLLTVPTIGWTPRDRLTRWGFSVARYGPQQATSPHACDAGNGLRPDGAALDGNEPLDTSLPVGPDFVLDWLAHIAGRVGRPAEGGVRFFALDGEPMLWSELLRDVHPEPVTYDELWQRTVEYAAAIKAWDPGARVLGPVSWGWCGYHGSAADAAEPRGGCVDGPDREAHGGVPLLAWYLQRVCAYEAETGVRLVDLLDVHYYSQDRVTLSPLESELAVQQRLRTVRSLYDESYVDESWIAEPVQLVPRLRGLIEANCPGVGLAISEYSWGSDDSPSSALAHAEVLAVLGREGVDLAARWPAPADDTRVADAFALYLDYDGRGARVAGDSVRAGSEDADRLGVYAVRGGDDRLFVLLFNRDRDIVQADVSVEGGVEGPARLFGFDFSRRLAPLGEVETSGAGFAAELPPRSATLAVVRLAG